jgi:hypothetical protein
MDFLETRRRRGRYFLVCAWFGHKYQPPPDFPEIQADCWCAWCYRIAPWWVDLYGERYRQQQREQERAHREAAIEEARRHRADRARVDELVAARVAGFTSVVVERVEDAGSPGPEGGPRALPSAG